MPDPERDLPRSERRRYLRIPLEVALKCHLVREGHPADTFDGRSLDLSDGGLSLRTAQPLPAGETLVVSFHLPDDATRETDRSPTDLFGAHRPHLMAMRGRVVWCERCEGEDYRLGVEFLTRNDPARGPLIDPHLDPGPEGPSA